MSRDSAGRSPAPIIALGAVGSTNDEAMARLRAAPSPLWVVAERQTAGRGRRGRPWVSETGNLYASYAFRPVWSEAALGLFPLAAAVALADALTTFGIDARVKWPNDVLVDGLKVSGILIETEWVGTEPRVVVGYGVNVAHHPSEAPATHLKAIRPDIDVTALHTALARTLADMVDLLGTDDGIAAVRDKWLARSVGVGGAVDVRLEHETRSGIFEGLDEEGRLMLRRTDNTLDRICAGDVFLRAAS